MDCVLDHDLPVQDYELTWFTAGDFQDPHGNTWCNAAFVGVSEPVRWVVKDPTAKHVGDKYYGKITQETSKAGKPYLRFRQEQKPEEPQTIGGNAGATKEDDAYWGEKNSAIKAQWAIGQAIASFPLIEGKSYSFEQIEERAKEYFAMVDRVKGERLPALPPLTPKQQDQVEDEEIKSLMEQEQPINLDDIPF